MRYGKGRKEKVWKGEEREVGSEGSELRLLVGSRGEVK